MRSLIVRLPNHLGDVCMSLPAIAALAARGIRTRLAGRPWVRELLAGEPWPVIALPAGRSARISALRDVGRKTGTEALLLTNSFSSALEFRLAGLRATGYARDGRSLLLQRAIPVPADWSADLHTVAYYLHLAEVLLDETGLPPANPHLSLDAASRARASAELARAGAAGAYVVLCPVARGLHHGRVKCWDGFARMARELRARGLACVICPGPGEREDAAAACPDATLLGALDLGAFGALLAASRLVIANDSGPGHLAAAVGARLVGVFGVTDPAKTRPLGAGVRIVGGAGGWPPYKEVAAAVTEALAA